MGKVFMDTPTRRQRRGNSADYGISGMPESRSKCRSDYSVQLPDTANVTRGTGSDQTASKGRTDDSDIDSEQTKSQETVIRRLGEGNH
eukprot:scaffold63381_cov45-Cyclotella_meneghiniana.AAC.3